MSKLKYTVEVVIYRYRDDTKWYANGTAVATFATEDEAEKFVDILIQRNTDDF